MQTMQEIYKPRQYPKEVLAKLKKMAPLAIEIANRWSLGWPQAVKALVESGEYLEALNSQETQERDVLSNPSNSHLARHEIVEIYGLSMAPPEASESWGPFCDIGDYDQAEHTNDAKQVETPQREQSQGLTSFEVSDPYVHDGKLIRAILSTHADGFVCLRFEGVESQGEVSRRLGKG